MKSLTVYDVYVDDGYELSKVIIPAESESKAKDYVKGNGEVVATKKDPFVQDIDTGCLAQTLIDNGWGQAEISVIVKGLKYLGLDRF